MEYTEKQIEEIILKSYLQGVFETIEPEYYIFLDNIVLNKIIIDNLNGCTQVFMYIHIADFNYKIINKITSALNMFDTPNNKLDNAVSFFAKERNTVLVTFLTTRACIQRLIDRSNKIEFKEE